MKRESKMLVCFLVMSLIIAIFGFISYDNARLEYINELNSSIESLESELKEKNNALIDLGWEEEIKLDDCPICDDKYVYIRENTTASDDTLYYIECNVCEYNFGYYTSKSELIDIWNSIDNKEE